ncbi:MAG TPA: hypothetical protein VMF30_15430 [Pirellulales bacterium]|nr:hypothetical protein [Pirellulales bacterium]
MASDPDGEPIHQDGFLVVEEGGLSGWSRFFDDEPAAIAEAEEMIRRVPPPSWPPSMMIIPVKRITTRRTLIARGQIK